MDWVSRKILFPGEEVLNLENKYSHRERERSAENCKRKKQYRHLITWTKNLLSGIRGRGT